MVAPGSLEARYHQLAGPPERRQELYLARTRLGYSIDDWLALPWWQRRVYIEGLQATAQDTIEQQEPRTGHEGLNAIYFGTIGDVAATTGHSTG